MTTTPERSATLTDLVAAEIRAWLGRLDVRPAELARRMGENDQWLSTRLKGRTPINVNDLHRIAEALGLQVHELLPAPDVAARASVSVRNPFVTDRTPISYKLPRQRSRGREEAPAGRTDSRRPETPRRTARLPRPGQREQG